MRERGLETFAGFFAKSQFLRNRGKDVIKLDLVVFREIPKIVKVTRLARKRGTRYSLKATP
jgi:hypothetical protein